MAKATRIVSLVAVLSLVLLAIPFPQAEVSAFVPPLPNEVWVATTGADVPTGGTEAQPFATIQYGINHVAEGGTVHVAAGTYVGSIDISKSLTLEGANAFGTVIDAGGGFNTVVDIGTSLGAPVTVSISGVTIQNGSQDAGGGIFIYSGHTLSLDDCTVRNNTASSGGGIRNVGTLIMNRCTVSGNSASNGGGGIYNSGEMWLTNCTISGNQLTEFGGSNGAGIANIYGTMELLNCTIAYNSTNLHGLDKAGGFYNFADDSIPDLHTAYFKNTIVANNTAGDDASNNGLSYPDGATVSQGYNLCGDNTCSFNQPTDLINTDPLLGPLQDNGGPTFTHALLHGSPAIDNGGDPGITDQRGVPRPQGPAFDIGAYELTQASVATATGTGTASFSTLNGYITDLTASTELELPCPPRPDLDFPFGLFSFTVNGITPGSTVTIVIILPSNAPTNIQYWKCINGNWVDCTSLLGSNNGDSILTITITDGGLGDRDGAANGIIVDPGGPAVFAPVAPAGSGVSPTTPHPLNPPQMSLQYLSITPQQTGAGQPVTITTNVVNTGDEAGNLNVALKINGQLEQSRMVSVGPHGTQPVKFTVTKAQPGTYKVDILDKSGSFTILGAGGTTGTPVNSGLIALLIIGVLVLATIVVLLLSRHPA